MLIATQLERVFHFDQKGQAITLPDPSPELSTEAVLNFYAMTYPILATAKIEGPEIKDDTVAYKFVTTIGTKG